MWALLFDMLIKIASFSLLKVLGSSKGVFSPMQLGSLWRELVKPHSLPPALPPPFLWEERQHLDARAGCTLSASFACLGSACPWERMLCFCPMWGVLCMPSCVRDGVTRGLSWQHSHVNCGPNPHPSCKHQRGCYSRWVRATLWTLLFFLCIVTGIEKREVYL